MHDSDPWAPVALLFAAVLFAGAGVDWHAVAEAVHTAAVYTLALLAVVPLCKAAALVVRRARAPRWAKWPPDSTLYPAGVKAAA